MDFDKLAIEHGLEPSDKLRQCLLEAVSLEHSDCVQRLWRAGHETCAKLLMRIEGDNE